MRLMLDNALSFNRPGSFHHRYAIRLRNWWAARVECMMVQTLGMCQSDFQLGTFSSVTHSRCSSSARLSESPLLLRQAPVALS